MNSQKNSSQKQQRQTQAQRREVTRGKIIDSASRLFGKQGFAKTSIDNIASETGLTEGAIYHHYSNKLKLFTAVTEHQELILANRIVELGSIKEASELLRIWEVFLEMCDQKDFVQIVLIDAPHTLGRERWQETSVVKQVKALVLNSPVVINMQLSEQDNQLLINMLAAALAEAALTIAKNPDYDASLLLKKMMQFFG